MNMSVEDRSVWRKWSGEDGLSIHTPANDSTDLSSPPDTSLSIARSSVPVAVNLKYCILLSVLVLALFSKLADSCSMVVNTDALLPDCLFSDIAYPFPPF